jgi:hypothetical protein
MRNRFIGILMVGIPLLCLLSFLAYNLPPINSRLAWRVDELRTRIKYALDPPEQAIFVPQQQAQLTGLPTPQVAVTYAPTATATPTLPGPTDTPAPSPTPTISPTPLPDQVKLSGVKYEDQHGRWNYCGPANLSMALTFWGWDGNRDVVGKLSSKDKDKNVVPTGIRDFVETQTDGLAAIVRSGGDVELLQRLVAAGFPVVAEKGYYEYDYTGKLGWLGHYQFVTGYDETKDILIVQDTYVKDGKDHRFPYEDFNEGGVRLTTSSWSSIPRTARMK